MFLHLERIWLEVLFFVVSLMQTWHWVAFEVAGTNTINTFLFSLSSSSFFFLFPLSPLYLSLSYRKKNSIFASRTSIYGICPECRKIQTYAWRGNNTGANQIARKPEVMRNRVTALKLLRCFLWTNDTWKFHIMRNWKFHEQIWHNVDFQMKSLWDSMKTWAAVWAEKKIGLL